MIGEGINTVHSQPHELRRIYADVNRHWLMTAIETTGIWKYFSSLKPFRQREDQNFLTPAAKRCLPLNLPREPSQA